MRLLAGGKGLVSGIYILIVSVVVWKSQNIESRESRTVACICTQGEGWGRAGGRRSRYKIGIAGIII